MNCKLQRLVRRWQVRHDEGPDYGLTPPDFATRGEACYRRDEFNKECPGHYVKMIKVAPNAANEPRSDSK
jgi:hypothetical protein